jgi:ATP-dependent DNA ligase
LAPPRRRRPDEEIGRLAVPACGRAFEDPIRLLAAVEKHGLEGIVSKRLDAPYLSGS